MHDAISYKRFSSLKQGRGDSDRRQTDLTEEYCKCHHLKLVDSYLDAGLSGFTGQNLSDGGALRALLEAAKAGKFKPGTKLIVESLDRLSRREISLAVRLFLDILDTGLVIVTLIDGEQVFTRERVDTDLTALIIVIVLLSRAHNESKTRRERALQAMQAARKRARERKIPITAECPRWLSLVGKGDDRHFVVDQSRAQVIEQIFNLCVSGLGERRIASYLNERGVLTFSGRLKWRISTVAHLLRSQAVLGLFQPCLSVVENGRRKRMPDHEGPIVGYFPAVVSQELFDKAQLAKQSRLRHYGHRTIPAHTNLVARLGCCAICGDSLYLSQSSDGFAYLRCVNAHDGECTNGLSFPYRKLEAVLLAIDDLMEFARRLAPQQTERAGVEQDVERAAREGFLARFKAAKAMIGSPHFQESLLGRRVLVDELRRLFEGVVLSANRVVTLHMKADATGNRVVCIIGYEGLRGIQFRAAAGTIGLIDPAALAGLVRPVQNGISKLGSDKLPWQPRNLDDLLNLTRIIYSPNGDWHAVAHDPTKIADVVASAEHALVAEIRSAVWS